MNTFGTHIRLTTFGESHGPAMGGVIDGLPSRFRIDFDAIATAMARRRPGSGPLASGRRESDIPEFLSGLTPDGVTLGTPVAFIVRNTDARSRDYDAMRDVYRPGHADFTYDCRYGLRDHRGGGRASARETVSRVVAGAIAMQLLESVGIRIDTLLASAGEASLSGIVDAWERNEDFTPDPVEMERIHEAIAAARRDGDSIGGTVCCRISGIPAGIGDPVYGKLSARLSDAMIGINAAKGFEYGSGFAAACRRGSENNDLFTTDAEDRIVTATNRAGGILGGISDGMPVWFRVAFKPTPSIRREQRTVDRQGRPTVISVEGRHDPCVALRGAAVVEAMAALTVADMMAARGYFFTENPNLPITGPSSR